MKCKQLWFQSIPKPQDPNTTLTNQVRSTAYNNDGSCTVAVVGDAILIYDSDSGLMLNKPIRGAHKQTINCVAFSKDGKRFATCSDDKSVVIFKYAPQDETKVSAELKYTHSEEVYTLSFNPLTGQIFSGGAADMAIWTPDLGNIDKHKYKHKITCSSWSSDGMTLALGTMSGVISLKTRKLEEKVDINRSQPVWCMDWTPITPDNLESLLCVGVWDQTITFYNNQGQQLGSSKNLPGFDPLSINFFHNGEFYILSGTNKKASLYAKEGGFLIDVCESEDWIWSARLRTKDMQASVVSNDGQIKQYKITPLTVYSLFQDKYACRDGLTDIMVQSIQGNQKVRVKCKELVKNVSVYKEKLAALLNERIVIYVSNQDDATLKYKLLRRINKVFDCQFFEVLSQNILIGFKNKIQLLKLSGELEREWILDARIKYLKNTGGPQKGENILVGLQNGQVLNVMINNSFPVILQSHAIPIVNCDLSMDRKKLAVVDKNKTLTVYDLISKEVVQNELHVTSCSFNTLFNDTICYSGQDMLFIKSGNQQPLSQRYQGKVVGLKGNKMFVLDGNTLNTIDVSQTTTMMNYIQKKEYKEAYAVACLGITENDFKTLGTSALQNKEFEIAKKCFLRINEIEYFELAQKYQKLNENGQLNETFLAAEVLAYQSEFHQAERAYTKAHQIEQAVTMWTELKRFDDAKRLIGSRSGSRPGSKRSDQPQPNYQENSQIQALLRNEAEHKKKMGNWKDAAQIYLDSRDYKRSIDIYIQQNHMEGLIEVCRQMDKDSNKTELQTCAYHFRKNKHHQFAKETYLKLDDLKSLVALHVEMEKFEEALLLGRQNPQLLEIVKIPYAHWLSKNDKYTEALQAFKQLGRHDLTTKMLNQLSQNAVTEKRFKDAAYYFWILATECLKLVSDFKNPVGEDIDYLQKYEDYSDNADIYYAYSKIYQYIEEPIQPLSGMAFLLHIFNASRFTINKLQNKSLFGVKQSFIYYALGKVSKQLEGYKTARQCYEKLSFYKINPDWNEEVDLSNLLIRSKPFSDKETLLPVCNRCMNTNPVISNGYSCTSCMHTFQNSFMSFENLPLVEFKIESNIPHNKMVELLYSDKSGQNRTKNKDGREEDSPFLNKLNQVFEIQQTSQEYIPIVLNEQIIKTLDPDQVYWIDYRKYCPSFEVRYFKCMVSDIALKVCQECCRFFFLDEFEFEYLKNKKCPFCQVLDQREGPQKDVFDI